MSVALDNVATNLDARGERFESGQGHRATILLPTLAPKRLFKLGGINAMYPDAHTRDIDRVAIDDLDGAAYALDLPAEECCSKDPEHGFSKCVTGQTQIRRSLASQDYEAPYMNSWLILKVVDLGPNTDRAPIFSSPSRS